MIYERHSSITCLLLPGQEFTQAVEAKQIAQQGLFAVVLYPMTVLRYNL